MDDVLGVFFSHYFWVKNTQKMEGIKNQKLRHKNPKNATVKYGHWDRIPEFVWIQKSHHGGPTCGTRVDLNSTPWSLGMGDPSNLKNDGNPYKWGPINPGSGLGLMSLSAIIWEIMGIDRPDRTCGTSRWLNHLFEKYANMPIKLDHHPH